jgi:hypothetical protein
MISGAEDVDEDGSVEEKIHGAGRDFLGRDFSNWGLERRGDFFVRVSLWLRRWRTKAAEPWESSG